MNGEPKPGIKTSEIWAMIGVLGGVNLWTQTSEHIAVQVAGLYATAAIVVGYFISRGIAKHGKGGNGGAA